MPKNTKKTAPKAPKAAKATPKPKAPKAEAKTRTIKVLNPKFEFGREGSVRRASWDALTKLKGSKTVEAYKANGGKAKYLPRWQKAGAIQISA